MSKHFGKFLAGLGLGIGIGLLTSPESGEKTRAKLKKKANNLAKDLESVDYKEVKDNIVDKINEVKKELEDLDAEKVQAIALEKAEVLKKKADKLYKEAEKAGKPYIEKAAKEVKTQSAAALKKLAKKLDEDKKEK